MIIIRLSGGLGNQLFQYALARKLKEKGIKKVMLDTSYFHPSKQISVTYRNYSLRNYNITLEPLGFFGTMLRKLKTDIFKTLKTMHNQKPFQYDEIVLKNDNCYLVGNWANPQYFTDLESVLRKEITLRGHVSDSMQTVQKLINNSESVFIHVRRGDYLKYPEKFVILPASYYEEAISIIKIRLANPTFFIFSDDLAFVKENLAKAAGENAVWVGDFGLRDYEELILMSKCRHGIIANSTFSWWGAYLNDNKDKIIIAPKEFRVDKVDCDGLIPKDWGWIRV